MSYHTADFAKPESLAALEDKVLPELRKVLDAELEAILDGGANANFQEAKAHAAVIKEYLCSFVDGVTIRHCMDQAGVFPADRVE